MTSAIDARWRELEKAFVPCVQKLELLGRQIRHLPLCAGHTLGLPEVEKIEGRLGEVDKVAREVWRRMGSQRGDLGDQNSAVAAIGKISRLRGSLGTEVGDLARVVNSCATPLLTSGNLWLEENKPVVERLKKEVREYYQARRLSGPGFVWGVPIPEPTNLVERMMHKLLPATLDSLAAMVDQIKDHPLWDVALSSEEEEGEEDEGEEIDEVLRDAGFQMAKESIASFDAQVQDVYTALGLENGAAFDKRFALYMSLWTSELRADMQRYTEVFEASDLAVLDYVKPEASAEERKRITNYYDYLRVHPEVMDGDHVSALLENSLDFGLQVVSKTYSHLITGILDLLQNISESEEMPTEEQMGRELKEKFSGIFEQEAQKFLENAPQGDRKGFARLRMEYIKQTSYLGLLLPMTLSKNGGEDALVPSKEISLKELTGRERAVVELVQAKDSEFSKKKKGSSSFHLNLPGFKQSLEQLSPEQAQAAVSKVYQTHIHEAKEALERYRRLT